MVLFSALKYKNYRLFFSGQAFSNLGNMMKQVAIGWLVYRLTDSALLLGVVTSAREIAVFVCSGLAGVVADRYNKHRLLMTCHTLIMITAFLLAWLTITDQITITMMILIQVVFGCISGVEMPSRQSMVNDLVEEKKLLTNAIALNSSLFNTARIAGPAIAGLLIPLIGEGYCFMVYGLMSFAVVMLFLMIKYKGHVKKVTKLHLGNEFMEGARYAYEVRSIRFLLFFVAAITLLGVCYIVVLPVFAADTFKAGSEVFGYMTSAIGVGSLIGAFLVGTKKKLLGLDKLILSGTLIFGLGLATFAMSEILWVSLIALMVSGYGRVLIFTGTNTLLQTIAADDKRGRVLSLYIMLFMGALSLGSFLIGLFSDLIGANRALLIGAVGVLACGLYYAKNLGTLRRQTYRIFKQTGAA